MPTTALRFTGPERRQLTVMFCDVVGSTALSRRLDPEELREILRERLEMAGRAVARYDGYIARYMGDGLLAYFGYPRAHEDDAARAIHAALEITSAPARDGSDAGPRRPGHPAMRVGIATGLVVVGDLIGQGAAREAAAIGETPHLAARLQTAAPPDGILVSDRTRELAGNRFVYAGRRDERMKGFDQPVHTWQVAGLGAVPSRFDVLRSPRMTPFVGRERELASLAALWQRAQQGHGQIVLLTGEAGIGKSRTAHTFATRLAGSRTIQLRLQCSPYHSHTALYPFIQQLERAAGFSPDDSVASRLAKLQSHLSAPPTIESDGLALLEALLSLSEARVQTLPPMTPLQRKQRTLAVLLDHLRQVTTRSPVVMLLEDAHWIDPTSSELLGLLATRLVAWPMLVCITCRGTAPLEMSGPAPPATLALQRLDRAESMALLNATEQGERFGPDVFSRIIDQTDGIPLFIEEFSKAVHAAIATVGATTASTGSEVPATLQDSLMARLDGLGDAKEVAQMAAVIGREFSHALIGALAGGTTADLDEMLERLQASDVISIENGPPHTTYLFRHALLRDAAYATLLRARRSELHRRVVNALEADWPERIRNEPEVLAYHCAQANLLGQSARYSAAAALRALDRSANPEALAHVRRGLETLENLVQGMARDQLELGLRILQGTAYRAVNGFASADVGRTFTRALELGMALGDERFIDVRRGLFSFHYARGELALAYDQGRRVVELAKPPLNRDAAMLGHWMLGCIASWRGEFVQARHELEVSIDLYEPAAQHTKALALQIDPQVNARCHLGWVLWSLGYPDRAEAMCASAVDAARRLDQPLAVAMTLFFACLTRLARGEVDRARSPLADLVSITTEHGLTYLGSCAKILEGQVLIDGGLCVEGIARVMLGLAEFEQQEAGLGVPWALSVATAGQLRLGEYEAAHRMLDAALRGTVRDRERHWEAELWRLRGEAQSMRRREDVDDSEVCFRRALQVAGAQGARALELRAATAWARHRMRASEVDAVVRLSEVRKCFSEGADTADLRDADALLRMINDSHSKRPQ